MEMTFIISLVGTLLWLGGVWFMPRSLRTGMVLQLASTGVFALLNIQVGAYPGLIGAAVGSVLMVRAMRRTAPRRQRPRPQTRSEISGQARALERVWTEALPRGT